MRSIKRKVDKSKYLTNNKLTKTRNRVDKKVYVKDRFNKIKGVTVSRVDLHSYEEEKNKVLPHDIYLCKPVYNHKRTMSKYSKTITRPLICK